MNAEFSFCVLVVFPSFCTSWRSLYRLAVDESLFVASQIHSMRDFLTPKLNKVPCLLFVLKFKSVGLLNLENHCLWFPNKHLNCVVRTGEETVFSVTGLENRIQTALIFSFSGKYFFVLHCCLVTDICNTVVISFSFEHRRYASHCCNRLAGNFYDRS